LASILFGLKTIESINGIPVTARDVIIVTPTANISPTNISSLCSTHLNVYGDSNKLFKNSRTAADKLILNPAVRKGLLGASTAKNSLVAICSLNLK
jgi:hypothetical protein